MENNLENKARFFAQYWGHRIGKTQPKQFGLQVVNEYLIDKLFDKSILELTSLSAITDEDAIEVKKIVKDTMYWDDGEDRNEFNINYLKRGIERMVCQNTGCWLTVKNLSYMIDYLRSKGYAMPYLDASVEDLVSMGWVKLKGA